MSTINSQQPKKKHKSFNGAEYKTYDKKCSFLSISKKGYGCKHERLSNFTFEQTFKV